ncbi:hypothetical protein BDAP_000882 [Binucleata daphniae]
MNITCLWSLIAINATELDTSIYNTPVAISPAKQTEDSRLSMNNNKFVISREGKGDEVLLKTKDDYYNIFVNNAQMCFSKQTPTPVVCKSEDAQGAAWYVKPDKNGNYEIRSKKTALFWKEMCLFAGDKLEVRKCKDTEDFKFRIKKYTSIKDKEKDDDKDAKPVGNDNEQSKPDEELDNKQPVKPDEKLDNKQPVKPDEKIDNKQPTETDEMSSSTNEDTDKPCTDDSNSSNGIKINCEDDKGCGTSFDKDKKSDSSDDDSEAEYCKESESESSSDSDEIDDKLKDFFDNIMCDKTASNRDVNDTKPKSKLVCNSPKKTTEQPQIENKQINPNLPSQLTGPANNYMTCVCNNAPQQNNNLIPADPNNDCDDVQKNDMNIQKQNENRILQVIEKDKNIDDDMCEDITEKVKNGYKQNDTKPMNKDNILDAIMECPNSTITKKQLIKYLRKIAKRFEIECKENINDKKRLLDKLCEIKGKIITINTKPRLLSEFELIINPFENYPKEIVKTYDDYNKLVKNEEVSGLDNAKKEFKSTYKDLVKEIKEEKLDNKPDLTVNIKDQAGNILSTSKRSTYKNKLSKILNFIRNIRKKDQNKNK